MNIITLNSIAVLAMADRLALPGASIGVTMCGKIKRQNYNRVICEIMPYQHVGEAKVCHIYGALLFLFIKFPHLSAPTHRPSALSSVFSFH